jgi:hypothetical protein
MKLRTCVECDDEFDPNSYAKRRAGGLANTCPECSEEHEPRALGFASGDGKMASISIVKCSTQEDADKLRAYWRLASGMHKGKECQMNNSATMPGVKFQTVTKSGSMNHKGKA